jgi:hypothetical protein
MVNAIYPDGTTPSAAITAYDWLLMFGPNGYFYQVCLWEINHVEIYLTYSL